MTWRRALEPSVRPLFFLVSRLTRGTTLGVRGVVTDAEGRVLLVEHTYLHGWWLPGGGVDRGETGEAAVIRELREEAGVVATGRPRLLSIHSNHRFFPGDHVMLYRIEAWTMAERTSKGEISRVGWFAPGALPPDVNRGSRARIEEALLGRPSDPLW